MGLFTSKFESTIYTVIILVVAFLVLGAVLFSQKGVKLMGRNQVIVVIVVLVILAIGGFLFLRNQNSTVQAPADQTVSDNSASPSTDNVDMTESSASPSTAASSPAASGSEAVKEFTVTGSSFKFEPSTLSVNKGDKVKITFKNSAGSHDFTIDEFNVKTKTLPSGGEEKVEFTADSAGTFEYYCSVGNHRAMGMKGTLTVK